MTLLVLGSSSPRRRQLLTGAGVRFVVSEPTEDEATPPPGMCGDFVVQLIARQKAIGVASRFGDGAFVLGADTLVVAPSGGLWGKPGNDQRAREMLRELRGSRHPVLTGVCAINVGTGTEALGMSRSTVTMREFDDSVLEQYIAAGAPLDCAGAYSVHGSGSDFIASVNGRVDNVLGLDVALALKLLAEVGYPEPLPTCTDVPLIPSRSSRRPLAPMRTTQRV